MNRYDSLKIKATEKILTQQGHFTKVFDVGKAINAKFQIQREIQAGFILLDLRKAVSSMDLGGMIMASKELIELIRDSESGETISINPGGGTWDVITQDPTSSISNTVGDGGHINSNEGLGWSEGEYGGFGSAAEELVTFYEVNN